MSKKTFDVLRMLRDMDGLQVERHPLPDHYAVRFDTHCRELYATMLAAMLLASGEVSDNESRLYKMLLNSLKLGDNQAKFFEQAQSINKDKLREFFRVVDEHKLAQSFFMDALVLCRLDAPITDARSQLLSQWVDLLKLNEQQTVTLSGFAANVLGLPTTVPMDVSFNHHLICVWNEWIFKVLTLADLKAGLKSNHWCVDQVFEVDFNVTIKNTHLEFLSKGEIRVKREHEIKIEHSHLQMPKMLFEQSALVAINSTVIKGDYAASEVHTAFSLQEVKAMQFSDLSVTTKNAQSFLIGCAWDHNKITPAANFLRCHFEACGSAGIIGGAISASTIALNVNQCSFIGCKAKLAGGIYGSSLKTEGGFGTSISTGKILNSYFEDCYSLLFPNTKTPQPRGFFGAGSADEDKDNGGAIFADMNASCFIEKCTFVRASVNLGKLHYKHVCSNSSFEDCYVFFEDLSRSHSEQMQNIKPVGQNSGIASGRFNNYATGNEFAF